MEFSLDLPVSLMEVTFQMRDVLVELYGLGGHSRCIEISPERMLFAIDKGRIHGHQLGACGSILVESLGENACRVTLNNPPYPGQREAVLGFKLLPTDPRQAQYPRRAYQFTLNKITLASKAEMEARLRSLVREDELAACELDPKPNQAVRALLRGRLEELRLEIYTRRRMFQFRALRRALVTLQADSWNLQAPLAALYQASREAAEKSGLGFLVEYPRPFARVLVRERKRKPRSKSEDGRTPGMGEERIN